MDNKNMDQLFRDSLDQEFLFHRQTEQWAEVAADLHPRNRRWFWGWYILAGLSVIGVLWFATSYPRLGGTGEVAPSKTVISSSEQTKVPAAIVLNSSKEAKKATSSTVKPSNLAPTFVKKSVSNVLEEQAISSPGVEAFSLLNINLPADSVNQQMREVSKFNTDLTYDYQTKTPARTTHLISAPQFHRTSIDLLPYLPSDLRPLQVPVSDMQLKVEPLQSRPTRTKGISILAGVQWQSTLDTAVQETISAVPYIGLTLRLHPRWQGTIRYTKTSMSRMTGRRPASYNIPLVEIPIGFTTPNSTELRYQQQLLEIGVSYRVATLTKVGIHLTGGTQIARHNDINTTYAYQNVYQSPVIETTLTDQPWHLAAAFTGISTEYPLIGKLAGTATYQRYWSTNRTYLRWRKNQQLHVGLKYQF